MSNIILFGSAGLLGTYVYRYLTQKGLSVTCITRKDIDLSTITATTLGTFMEKYHLDSSTVVINAAGIIPQALLNDTSHDRSYIVVNTIFPIMLAQLCANRSSKMIHVTTDCIYTGAIGKYTENDASDVLDLYGLSKSLGELCDCTIIRTSIIGEEVFTKRSLLEWTKSNRNGTINGFTNCMWNGVTTLQLAQIMYQMITENIWWTGVRHIFSPNTVSKYELVTYINQVFSLGITVNKFCLPKDIDKSIDTVYDTNSHFIIPDILDQIKELVEFSHILYAEDIP